MPRKAIAYELVPIYEGASENTLRSAALVTCALTDEILTGSGGGGVYVSPRVFRGLARGEIKLEELLESDADQPDPEEGR